ncbi:MAG TPA: glycosyltransferase family 4 protein [Candidatus Saccharimonadales bacterium]|nr:glycosyltransferase family 4 protein [Candidatus Saccharimonadales bacterium]
MTVTHIIQVSSYYPPHLGGQENAVQGLAQQLAKAGHRVTVLTSTNGGGAPGVTTENGVTVHRMPSLVFGHAPIMPQFAAALLGAVTPGTVVHIHIGQAFTPEMVWLVSKLRGFAYIAQLHIDFEPSGPAGILLPLYKKFVLKRALQSAAAVITLNQKTHRIVRRVYDYTGTALVMDNGIDDSFFRLRRAPFTPHPPKTLRLLFVGRLTKQKNLITLLYALALTKRAVQLDVVGEGPEREQVEATIAQLKLKNVKLHGRLAREQVMKLYQTHDALIMPSLYEAQPLVLLEAMAARIPIIGTKVIGVEDHIAGVGILVKPTAEGLAHGIESYDTMYQQLPAMVKKGHDTVEKLRWPHILKKYETLYEQATAH